MGTVGSVGSGVVGQVGRRNVLVFVSPILTPARELGRQGFVEHLASDPGIEHVEVVLPRAELMLRPRLVGLWDALVFLGGSGGDEMPGDEEVRIGGEELFQQGPKVILGCHPADLWPEWQTFQSYLYRQGADQRWVDLESTDAAALLTSQLFQ